MRLASAPHVRWSYAAGDPFQSIYAFAGADPAHFMACEARKQEVMPRSHRCAMPILELGEAILRGCSDWFDRAIEPAGHRGVIGEVLWDEIPNVVENGSWLVLARTNHLVASMARKLSEAGIPVERLQGRAGPTALTRAVACLDAMSRGEPVAVPEWLCVLKHVPSKPWIMHGAKAYWQHQPPQQIARMPKATAEDYSVLGAEPCLLEVLKQGRMVEVVPEAAPVLRAAQRCGWQRVFQPTVKIGTIHSAKGMEADGVVLCDSIPSVVLRSLATTKWRDAELRVWYVGVTRARSNLIVTSAPHWNRKSLP